jgi:glycosyltransferase involved in cell wall biosynthesis
MSALTVILCTHNPRPEFLREVLAHLKQQTLPVADWEFLLIDNASASPLADTWDLSWHPHARHVRENELGLTPARLRGIAEAKHDVIVFVDDDNLLAPDYLSQVRRIAEQWPMLGIWGGAIRPRFESPAPAWTRPHWGMLAIVECTQARWSNLPDRGDTRPCGAGMIVRTPVARRYAEQLRTDARRKALGRRGNALTSAEDTDLVLTALDLGYGSGVFPELQVEHIIPAGRLEESYLLRLAENMQCSGELLFHLRGKPNPPRNFAKRVYDFLRLFTLSARDRRFELARRKGRRQAEQLAKQS